MTKTRKTKTKPAAKLPGTVEEIIARIIALHDASQSGSDKAYALKRCLAREFGRRNGWEKIAGDAFNVIDILAKTTRRPDWIEPNHDHFDHGYYYRLNGRAVAIAAHLYDVEDKRRAEIETWAAIRGLQATFPTFPSWWNPGETTLVLYQAAKTNTAAAVADEDENEEMFG